MQRTNRRVNLFRCAWCGYGAIIRREPGSVYLLGRLVKRPRIEWVCRICIGGLAPSQIRRYFGRSAA